MATEYKIQAGQNIFDIANINLATLDTIVLGLLSPSGISLIDSLTPTENVTYDSDYYLSNTIQIELDIKEPLPTYETIGLENQSIFDACILNYANLDKISEMIIDNENIVSILDLYVTGKGLIFNKEKLSNGYIVEAIEKKNYPFGTISDEGDFVWDGEFDIWDGSASLVY